MGDRQPRQPAHRGVLCQQRPRLHAGDEGHANAQVCYDYGMDGNLAPGSGVTNYQQWNSTILSADAADINCADVHWYPINGVPTESVQSIMSLVDNIPAAAAEVHSALSQYDPSAYFVVGETNMSQTANAWNEEPVGALFAAANAMEWLSFGAQSVDWWDVHNYGTPTADFGMFSSGSSGGRRRHPVRAVLRLRLASKLAVKGATVGTLLVPTPNIYAYYSKQPGGGYSVMLVNADPSNGYTIPTSSLGITSTTETEYAYSAASPSVRSGNFSGASVNVPAESIVVLSGGTGQPSPTPTPSGTPSQSPSASPSVTATPSRPPRRPPPRRPPRQARAARQPHLVNVWKTFDKRTCGTSLSCKSPQTTREVCCNRRPI